MGTYGFPDIQGFYDMLYGTAGVDFGGYTSWQVAAAAGLVWGGNPPFRITDFISIYPKFAGPPSAFTGLVLEANSATVTGFTAVTGIATGQLVVNLNSLPKDTTVLSVNSEENTITLSNPASANDTVLTIYETPPVPLIVILTYISLAQISLLHGRYHGAWFICMCYFVAHYITLWLRTEAGAATMTQSQVASSGLAKGIITNRAAGVVSAASKFLEGYEEFGAWGETQYGELFITMARAICAGPIFVQ